MNQYMLPFKPGDSVMELGGGGSPYFHPNYDIRKLPTVDHVIDFNKRFDIPDNSFQGIFSHYVLEHVSWRKTKHFLRECLRILKPGGTGIWVTANLLEQARTIVNKGELNRDLICMVMGGQRFRPGEDNKEDEEDLDEDWVMNAHFGGFCPSYINKLMAELGYEHIKIIPIPTVHGITDMAIEGSKPIHQPSENMIKLNIGSFVVMSKGWTNIDKLNLHQYALQNGYEFKELDVTKGLPYEENSVNLISASHFIEHIDRNQGKQFLKECFRIMKPGTVIRLTIPDTETIVKDYISKNISRHSSHNVEVKNAEDDTESLFHLLIAGHKSLYDFASLSKQLGKAGFIDIKKQEYQKSYSKDIESETRDMYPELSLYIEARKPKLERIEKQTGPIITKGNLLDVNNLPNIKYDDKSTKQNIDRKLRIALISTPFFKVPPDSYGGLEQVVYDLAMGLDELGHEVTIFAPEGSKATPHGHLVEMCKSNNTVNVDWYELEKQNYQFYKDIIIPEKFDIIHDHSWFGFPYLLKQKHPSLKIIHTMHGGLSWTSPPNW